MAAMGLRSGATLGLAAALAAGGAAHAADARGAAALQAALNGFFADIEEMLPVDVTPDAPVTVVPDGDGYRASVAALSISGTEGVAEEGGGVLAVAGFDVLLWPQPDDPDRTAFATQEWPAATLTVDGAVVAELTARLVSDEGVWSHALGLPIVQTTVIEDLRLQLGTPLEMSGTADGFQAVLAAARLDVASAITDRGGGSWDMRSKTSGADIGVYLGGGAFGEGLGPVDPATGLAAVYHYGTISSDSLLADVPLAAWGDYLERWLRLAAERASGAVGSSPEDDRGLLVALFEEAPQMPDRIRLATAATDITAAEIAIARQTQTFEVTGLAGDVLTMRQSDSADGLVFNPTLAMPPLVQLGALMPESYWYELVLRDLPLGHAWRALADTADAWAGDPDAAAEVFFRSLGERALTLGTAAELDLRLSWPESQFLLDLDLAVGETAERVVAGTIDGVFEDMAAFGDRVGAALGDEAASAMLVLEAFGQRETPSGDGPAVTRYRVEIGADGRVTFNGQSYDAVMRMIDEAIENGLDGLGDMIPTPD